MLGLAHLLSAALHFAMQAAFALAVVAVFALVARMAGLKGRKLWIAAGVGLAVSQVPRAVYEWNLWRGDRYFADLCAKEAGRFIYRTVDDVDGVYQMRLREGDYYDRVAKGDPPEDPYGHATAPVDPWITYRIYRFFERPATPTAEVWDLEKDPALRLYDPSMSLTPKPGESVVRFYGHLEKGWNKDLKPFDDGLSKTRKSVTKEYDRLPRSEYGFTFNDVGKPEFGQFNIRGGELKIVALRTNEVIAVRRGFVRYGAHYAICPDPLVWEVEFVTQVLRPRPLD